ncbi:GHMP family kinase ATP-binding protein [Methylophilus aquaticus]|uniref:GHMP kinase N-terminal domain-containing protein n=1 Tax=Methylophilus aquaticus TaxID=1971610 RepID=A0ABT9JVW0_9PROT|nr:hypothetical protein [Methylophilus aquaticus]MDP8568649.1 hypothetical protein [Methylophilus aquaticus]
MISGLFSDRSVSVTTFGRLHLGFFDLSQQSIRRFGSMGVSIDAFQTSLTASFGTLGNELPWLNALLQRHLQGLTTPAEVRLQLHQAIPRHGGLGSGTQMALAVGAAVNSLLGYSVNPAEIAARHDRGGRSGIGIATFAHGGLILDGGKGPATVVPPMLARYAFPDKWCFLLMMQTGLVGVHGLQEKTAFQQLKPHTLAETQALAHQVLMHGLPALQEQDFEVFAAVVGALQDYNGTYFASAQGGRYASPAVTQVITYLKQQGHVGLGQTSWGPTGFVMMPTRASAHALKEQLLIRFSSLDLDYHIVHAVNHGALLSIHD